MMAQEGCRLPVSVCVMMCEDEPTKHSEDDGVS